MHKTNAYAFTIALLSSFLLPGAALAAASPPGALQPPQAPPPPTAPIKHTLQGTYFSSSGSALALPGVFTTFDTQSLKCTVTTGCTIELDSMIEFYEPTSSTNSWAICAYVDGTAMTPGCFYAGVATKGTGDIDSIINTIPVAFGSHTLTVYAYSSSATASLAEFQDVIKIYKP